MLTFVSDSARMHGMTVIFQTPYMGAFWIRRGLFEHARRVVGLRGHVKNADLKCNWQS
jgi:hypothetical protein